MPTSDVVSSETELYFGKTDMDQIPTGINNADDENWNPEEFLDSRSLRRTVPRRTTERVMAHLFQKSLRRTGTGESGSRVRVLLATRQLLSTTNRQQSTPESLRRVIDAARHTDDLLPQRLGSLIRARGYSLWRIAEGADTESRVPLTV